MTGLEERLRTALRAEADLWPSPQEGRLARRQKLRSPPGWAMAGATAAAVLVVVAGSVWVFGLGSGTESQDSARPISALPPIELGAFQQVAGGNGELGVEPLSEQPDENGDILATNEIAAVASGRRGVVAVGILDGSGGGIGAIWYSPDGSQWQRVPHDDTLFGVPGEVPNTMLVDVAANDSGFLAVGVRFTEPRQRIVLTSPDGLTWTRRDGPQLDASAVVATDFGWTVVGSENLQGEIWNSSDGVNWEATASPTFSSPTHAVTIMDIAHDGERFVAVGASAALAFREDRPMVWVSDDGEAWRLVEDGSGVFDLPAADGIESVVAGPGGFVGVGEERIAEGDEPTFGVAWFSATGEEWERVRLGEANTGRPIALTSSSAGYVVLGIHSEDGVSPNTRLWSSTDGQSWEVVDPGGLQAHLPRAVLAIDRRLLLFGSLLRDNAESYDNLGLGEGAVWEAAL